MGNFTGKVSKKRQQIQIEWLDYWFRKSVTVRNDKLIQTLEQLKANGVTVYALNVLPGGYNIEHSQWQQDKENGRGVNA